MFQGALQLVYLVTPDGRRRCPHLGAMTNKAVGNITYRSLCECEFSLLCSRVQLLSHTVVASLEFLRSRQTFPEGLRHSSSPPAMCVTVSPHLCQHLGLSLFCVGVFGQRAVSLSGCGVHFLTVKDPPVLLPVGLRVLCRQMSLRVSCPISGWLLLLRLDSV